VQEEQRHVQCTAFSRPRKRAPPTNAENARRGSKEEAPRGMCASGNATVASAAAAAYRRGRGVGVNA